MTEQYYPKDLIINPTAAILAANTASDKNNFTVVVPDLKIDSAYTFQFQYVFEDGVKSDWSPSKLVVIGAEPLPGAPVITAEGGAGFIKVGLATFPTNAFRVDIRISGGTFGSGTVVVDSFTSAGTKTITAAGGSGIGAPYSVSAITVSPTKTSIASTPITVYVTDPTADIVIEPPTLPAGLSVSTAPFAVAVKWNGSYASSTFKGFKSIDIHVRGTDVGSTATSGFSSSTQVATLSVNDTTNIQNISLDNLRQALGLTNNSDAYTAPAFYYYIAKNIDNSLYSVGGTPTYTRINSTTVNPTKANFVDLINGVISIENLVAGNGNFSSYLRIGSKETSGGARIELSGVDNFTDALTTRTVQRGLTAYDSGNNEVLRFDYGAATPKLEIKGNATFSGALQAATGDFTGSLQVGSSSNPVITNITSDGTYVTIFAKTILAVGDVISISGVRSSNAFVTVTNAVGNGTTVTYTGSNTFSIGETVTVSGITPFQYNLKGVIVNRTSSQFTISSNKTGAFISGGVAGYPHVFDLNNVTVNRITDAAGNHITTSGVDVYAESFRVINSTTGSYTSGGSIVRSAFQVGSTGILKAAEGIIGGWLISGSKLMSSGTSSRIELDPLTPAITLFNSSGNIQISASNGITHSSGSFNLTAAGALTISGVITAASGSNIAGWQTTSNAMQSPTANMIFNSSGSIVSTGTIASQFNTTVSTTSTLSSGYIDVFSNENTIAFLGMSDGLTSGAGAVIRNNTNSFTATAVGISLKATSTQNGVTPGGFYITHASGDYLVHLGFYDDSTFPTSRKLKFDHWGNSAQRTQDNAAIAYDTATQSLRPMVIDSDGTAYLGWSQYFSTTLTTTPSSGTGQNGDIYLSTA